MANGTYSSVMIIAADGLVNNQGINISGNLSSTINSYVSINAVSSFGNVLINAAPALSSTTFSTLQQLGGTVFPALTDAITPSLASSINLVYGNSIANVYGNGVYTFTDVILAQADRFLGNTASGNAVIDGITYSGPDLSKFAQIYGMCQGYRITSNQLINSVNSSEQLDLTFINMDNLTTGGITQINTALRPFGQDLVRLGDTLDFSRLKYFGHPWVLLLQMIAQGGLLPSLYTALVNSGVTPDELSQVQSDPFGTGAQLDQKIYKALQSLTGAELTQVRILLNVSTPGLTSAADLLNPKKMLPTSYKTLTTRLPSGTTANTTASTSTYVSWKEYSESWSKSGTLATLDRNWGLYRSWLGSNPTTAWGYNGSALNQLGTVTVNASGKNVDVVIVDAVIDPNHPELAVYSDGTGGSRVKYFNWYSLNIPGDPNAGNVYNPPITTTAPSSSDDSRHATHVAGIAAGNTQGWAPNANIYNISPQYVTGGVSYLYLYKYILAWHNKKRAAGNMTPTICNNSWYSRYTIPYTDITSLTYQGVVHAGPFTILQLKSYGISVDANNNAIIPLRNAVMDADIQACINAGIIMVACAGNDDMRIAAVSTDIDYNNTVTATGFNGGNPIYYSRGSSPGSTSNVICVGSIGAGADEGADRKSSISNCGPRVNIFAPGSYITSSWLTANGPGSSYPTPIPDPRNANYYIAKDSGTSMASPQVCGILACALETNPTYNQNSILSYIVQAAKVGQIPDSAGGPTDVYSLQGAPNRYLTVPNNLLTTSSAPNGVQINIYTSSGAIDDRVAKFYSTDPAYIELSRIVPPEQAAASLAWARSLYQVKNINNILLPDFATAVLAMESNSGLTQINELTKPIPIPVRQNVIGSVGTGTGPDGKLTIYDFMGTLAGYPYTTQLPIVTAGIKTLSSATLAPLINPTTGIYAYMNNTLAGDYNDPDPATTITIPSGPAAGTYANVNVAFTNGLIPAANTIVNSIAASSANVVTTTNTAETLMINQIELENQNLKRAGVNFIELQGNSKPAVMSIATNLHEIGQDVSEYGPNQFFTAIADTNSLSGQAIVASLREGRNLAVLSKAGIETDTQLPDF